MIILLLFFGMISYHNIFISKYITNEKQPTSTNETKAILDKLNASIYIDKSPKGFLDAPIVDLVNMFFTLSLLKTCLIFYHHLVEYTHCFVKFSFHI